MERVSAVDVLVRHLVLTAAGAALLFVLPDGAFGSEPVLPVLGGVGGVTRAHLAGLAVIVLAWVCFALRIAASARTWRTDPASWAGAGIGLAGLVGLVHAGVADAVGPVVVSGAVTVAGHTLLAMRLERLRRDRLTPAPVPDHAASPA